MKQVCQKLHDLAAQHGLDAAPESLADLCWLAAITYTSSHAGSDYDAGHDLKSPRAEASANDQPQANRALEAPRQSDSAITNDGAAKTAPAKGPSRPLFPAGASGSVAGRSIAVAGPQAIAEQLRVDRAFKPLRERMPDLSRLELDEDATAEASAELDGCVLCYRPALGRWLDVILLIDNAPTMRIWDAVAREFARTLQRALSPRSFATAQVNWCYGPDRRSRVSIETGGRVITPRDLHQNGRASAVFLLTDAVGPGWMSGDIPSLLNDLASHTAVAAIQVLPRHLWDYTSFLNRPSVSAAPALQSGRWKLGVAGLAEVFWSAIDDHLLNRLALHWSGRNGPAPEVIVNAENPPDSFRRQDFDPTIKPAISPIHEPDDEEIADIYGEFMSSASQPARELAMRLAAIMPEIPLTLPLMQLIQRSLVRNAVPSQMAELFLAGLLERTRSSSRAEQVYRFRGNIRERLSNDSQREWRIDTRVLVTTYLRSQEGRAKSWLGAIPVIDGESRDTTVPAQPEGVADLILPESSAGAGMTPSPLDADIDGRRAEPSRMESSAGRKELSMPVEIHCPKCGSTKTVAVPDSPAFQCVDCRHEFTPEKSFVPKRIFLSHGHDESVPLAIHLRDDLRNRGHDVWFAEERLQTGDDWETFIGKGLEHLAADKRNAAVILLLTPHSVRRPDGYCLNEVARALSRGLRIIPLMVVASEPPLSICRIQWLDMRGCIPIHAKEAVYLPRFERLLKALEENQLDFEGTQQRLLKALQPLEFDADILRHLPKFAGRQWVFDAIDKWLAENPPKQRVFWISGGPGVGKTAISAVLSSRYLEVAALHLCKFGHAQKNDPRSVVTSIVYQLTTQLPEYEARLASMDVEKLAQDDARTMFDKLLVQPLAKLTSPNRPVVILIDALDEATRGGRNELASLIAVQFPKTPAWLRLIITSRPEAEVTAPLQGLNPFILDTDIESNRADLREYLRRELAPQLKHRPEADHLVEQILNKSEGMFLYVERLCNDVQLGEFSLDHPEQVPVGLGGVFREFFQRQFPDPEKFRKDVHPGLCAILAARVPLPVEILQRLFNWQDMELRKFIRSLASLFPVITAAGAEVIKPYHVSVKAWLSDESTAGSYFVNLEDGHRLLADHGWHEYKHDSAHISAYMSSALEYHLRAIGDHDRLAVILQERKILEASPSTPPPQVTQIKSEFSISVGQFFENNAKALNLELQGKRLGFERPIREPATNLPGLALAGFFSYFAPNRVQVLGNPEMVYLSKLPDALRADRFRRMCDRDIPCIVVARGSALGDDLLQVANDHGIPVFGTLMVTTNFLIAATIWLEQYSSQSDSEQRPNIEVSRKSFMVSPSTPAPQVTQTKSEFSISVGQFFENNARALSLELQGKSLGFERPIREPATNRPGLALAGFFSYFAPNRVQVLGNPEMVYLSKLPDALRADRFRRMCDRDIPCIVVARGSALGDDLLQVANDHGIPVFGTSMTTTHFLVAATIRLEQYSSPSVSDQQT